MQILVQSKTLSITAALRAFIERQARKLSRRGERVQAVTVFVETVGKKKNDVQSAIAKMKVSLPGRDLMVERRAQDLYEAVIDVTARAARQIRKTKERRIQFKRSWRLPSSQGIWEDRLAEVREPART